MTGYCSEHAAYSVSHMCGSGDGAGARSFHQFLEHLPTQYCFNILRQQVGRTGVRIVPSLRCLNSPVVFVLAALLLGVVITFDVCRSNC